MKKGFILVGFLALMLMLPVSSMAKLKALSDAEMGAVGAKGVQVVTNSSDIANQQNNNDSVQLNMSSLSGASGMDITTAVSSAITVEQDIDTYDFVSSFSTIAISYQYAENHKHADQSITNYGDVDSQNNNNGSVQLNDSSLVSASSLNILNAADTAHNTYQRLTNVNNSFNVSSITNNKQDAYNSGYETQTITNYGDVTNQNNNNSSVQLNGNALSSASSLVISNSAGSAENVAQMIGSTSNSVYVTIGQHTTQYAENSEDDIQTIANSGEVNPVQNNNNGSVQLNDSAEASASALLMTNTATSAANFSQNIINVANDVSVHASQSNVQEAHNVVYPYQTIENYDDSELQNNNNASVQLNGDAQSLANSLAMANTADSAMNLAQNVVNAVNINGLNIVEQSNEQEAYNGEMSGDSPLQNVVNVVFTDTYFQDNNQASVQLNDNAQEGASSMIIANTASSAANVAQNVANLSGVFAVDTVIQSNTQHAENYSYWSQDQIVGQNDTFAQKNNLNSVQLNDNAQEGASSMIIANTADSAMNIAQNIASTTELIGFNAIIQSNDQVAINGGWWGNWSFQDITNNDIFFTSTAWQDNNNSSVQLNDFADAQDSVSAMIVANTANSAENIAQNVANAANLASGNLFSQSNTQYAENGVWVAQDPLVNSGLIVNRNVAQDNNNGSVQILSGQSFVDAMVIANTAVSAENIAQNVVGGFSLFGLNGAFQINDQTAYEYAEADQNIVNSSIFISATLAQYNNNASVQVKHDQDNLNTMILANTALSAENIAQNIGGLFGLVNVNVVSQSNIQYAENRTLAYQEIDNASWVLEVNTFQDSNNASVQAEGAQGNISAMIISNVANSAANVAQNIANLSDIVGLDFAMQSNTQEAYNYSDVEQDITNLGVFAASYSLAQDNNNASVQLSGSQNNTSALSILNASTSAVNVGENIAAVFNPIGFNYLEQSNNQTAVNSVTAYQDVYNDIAIAQDNNNGSVQLNNSQNYASGLSILNASVSAVNVGLNIASLTGSVPFGTVVSQTNTQYAENAADVQQTVDNGVVILPQDNNNGSVQLNNSQIGATALLIRNIANSATNYGQNIAHISGASGITMTQTNYQTAINY